MIIISKFWVSSHYRKIQFYTTYHQYIDFDLVGVPNEDTMEEYLRVTNDNYLRAFIMACGDGQLGAVMALSPLVPDINLQFDGKFTISSEM